jgi:ubiquinone/menaquinone biosynthesis C-methylase UbiE
MNIDTFYTDHWSDIEDERVARYEKMFQWRPEQAALLAPAKISEGHRVLDFGCGPGFLTGALADRVGSNGEARGVDINARFVRDANARAQADGITNLSYHHLNGPSLPFEAASFDVAVAKNVLEYVPDVASSLAEISRVLKPGGRLHAVDSDWGFIVVEPWAKAEVDEFFAAAGPAFKEPLIGRKLAGLFSGVGLDDIQVTLQPMVDRTGAAKAVLLNMAHYIGTFATLDAEVVTARMASVDAAIEDGSYLFCLPQFLVTGTKR